MPGRNFDELLSQERTFVVRGETFTWQDVRPEILDQMLDTTSTTNGKGEQGEGERDLWAEQDKMILEFLVPEDRARWKKLRSRTKEPITIRQFNAILEHLVSEQTDRPTQQPSPSGSGRGRTAGSSEGR